MDELLLLHENKENFFCAATTLLRKIQILEENIEEDNLFENLDVQTFEDTFYNSIENFSYKTALIRKKEKKFYMIVYFLKIYYL